MELRLQGPNIKEPANKLAAYQMRLLIEAPEFHIAIFIVSEFHEESTVADVKKLAHATCDKMANLCTSNEASDAEYMLEKISAKSVVIFERSGGVIDNSVLAKDILLGETEKHNYILFSCSSFSDFATQLPPVDDVRVHKYVTKLGDLCPEGCLLKEYSKACFIPSIIGRSQGQKMLDYGWQ